MISSDLRNHLFGIVRVHYYFFTSKSYFIFIVITPRICTCGCVAAKSANEDPTVRLLRSGNYAPWQKMDACWTYVLSRLTYHLTVSKFPSIKQSTAEYNRTLDADQALLSMETFTDFVKAPR
ncbi:conserved hypothetical protein [Trichinella spiralis]|uniref:hypothetical protein n=1 Tax=Trichinella spiralis TaxID=6334 RepID=UPI0001EFDA65|nr:conserved hypothetical protein [Trichinella spiralis]